jgi:hypothetical protein
MLDAFVFLNCDTGTEPVIPNEITVISGVSEAVKLSRVCETVAKVSEESPEDIAKSVGKSMRLLTLDNVSNRIEAEKDELIKQIA